MSKERGDAQVPRTTVLAEKLFCVMVGAARIMYSGWPSAESPSERYISGFHRALRMLYFHGNFRKPTFTHNTLFPKEFPERCAQGKPRSGSILVQRYGTGGLQIHVFQREAPSGCIHLYLYSLPPPTATGSLMNTRIFLHLLASRPVDLHGNYPESTENLHGV